MQAKRSAPRTVKLSVTVKCHLERKYDAAALKQINTAIKSWIKADANRGIHTVHVAVDDSAAMRTRGVRPVSGKATPRKIKRAVDDLWKRLAPDYLVLFGGADIVPMFDVVNPSHHRKGDDQEKVPTDNPYASSLHFLSSKRRSYLVPDRVIGRIPDMVSDTDPSWLVDYLATATSWRSKPASFYREAYAICCFRWRRAGVKCMRYIAKPLSHLLTSPPTRDIWTSARNRLSARLHMIKCHGSQLDAKFYGQKWNRYPTAVTSPTLRARLKPATVVATTCCYGAQIFSPADPAASNPGEWPLASTYLRKGALGFVGPTMIAWVGDSKIDYADWIVAGYLKSILEGASIGRAFLQSKQDYLRWIHQEGHVADLADEKTLVEYILLGDPSIHPVKSVMRPEIALAAEERRQRRVARTMLATGIREFLPTRSHATPAEHAMAKEVFINARSVIAKDAIGKRKEFEIKPTTVRVERVDTRLPASRERSRGPRVIQKRQSLEYYWSERRVHDGHKQIRLLKAETDQKGNLWRTAVIHSS